MPFPDAHKMLLERHEQSFGQPRDTVPGTLAIPDQHQPIFKIDVLDAQLQTRAQAQSGTVDQTCHEPVGPLQARQEALRFGGGQHARQSRRALGAVKIIKPGLRADEHLLVAKQQRRERLILCGCGYAALPGKVVEKSRDPGLAKITRMPFVVEVDEVFDPVDIGILGAQAVMPSPDEVPHLIEQPRRSGSIVRFYSMVTHRAIRITGIFYAILLLTY